MREYSLMITKNWRSSVTCTNAPRMVVLQNLKTGKTEHFKTIRSAAKSIHLNASSLSMAIKNGNVLKEMYQVEYAE